MGRRMLLLEDERHGSLGEGNEMAGGNIEGILVD